MAGMPRSRAWTAALAASAGDSRSTPGMDGTGTLPSPSCRIMAQIRSEGETAVSRTRRRIQSAWRRRRGRRAGKAARGGVLMTAASYAPDGGTQGD